MSGELVASGQKFRGIWVRGNKPLTAKSGSSIVPEADADWMSTGMMGTLTLQSYFGRKLLWRKVTLEKDIIEVPVDGRTAIS